MYSNLEFAFLLIFQIYNIYPPVSIPSTPVPLLLLINITTFWFIPCVCMCVSMCLLVFFCLLALQNTHFPFFLGKGYPTRHVFLPCFFHQTMYPKSYSKFIYKDLPHSFSCVARYFQRNSFKVRLQKIRTNMYLTLCRKVLRVEMEIK